MNQTATNATNQNPAPRTGWVRRGSYERIKGDLDRTVEIIGCGRKSYKIRYTAATVEAHIIGRG